MDAREVIAKADRGEGLTVEEIKIYHEAVKPQKHVYGKYGTRLSSDARYCRTGNFLEDYRRQTEMQGLIEEEILREIVYTEEAV